MYIPVMAFVTYILLSTLLAGLRGAFHPEVMGLTATTAFAIVAVEILGLKFGTYILSISNDSQLLDLVAYSGYKFVGVIVTLVVAEILNRGRGTGGWVGWTVFTYTFLANAFFLVSFSALSLSFSIPFAILAKGNPLTAASSGPSNTSSSQTPLHQLQQAACKRSTARSETDEHNSFSFTATWCSLYSCGCSAGRIPPLPRS